MTTLDERRETLEAQIWELFPQLAQKKRPPNLIFQSDYLGNTRLTHRFQDVSSQQAIAIFEEEPYWFTDVDDLSCFPAKTFIYYLPAFLIAMLHRPDKYPADGLLWFWDELYGVKDSFTFDQDQILIAFFEWLVDFRHSLYSDNLSFGYWETDDLETYALKWMLIVDKKKAEFGRKYLR